MRVSAFVLMGTLLTANLLSAYPGNGQNDNKLVTLDLTNRTYKEVFLAIEEQADVVIMCELTKKELSEKVSIHVREKPVAAVLDEILNGTDLKWTHRKNIFRIENAAENILPAAGLAPPSVLPAIELPPVTGVVRGPEGEPLAGVNVVVKGTQRGVVTDVNGRFLIEVGEDDVLVISHTGMKPQEISVRGRSVINIDLELADARLDEIVVIGYGTARKTDLTGAVQRVDREELNSTAPSNVLSAMQGKLAGVNVTQNDGAPGAGISLRIRGSNSFLGGTEPLYVIDGVPFNNNNSGSTPAGLRDDEKQTVNALSFLNPNDIESIDVLKDASATAIYGSRGANGVVLITTRKGRTGKDKVEVSAVTGISEVSKKLTMLDAVEYATYQNTAYSNSNKYAGTAYDLPFPGEWKPSATNPDSLVYYNAPADYEGLSTDWQDIAFQKALYQSYSVNVSGGNEAGNHSLSFNYLNQDGVIVNSNYRRFGINFNANRNIGRHVKIGTSTVLGRGVMNGVKTGTTKSDDSDAGVIRAALSFPSTATLIDPATNTFSYIYFVSNPYIYTRDVLNKITSNNIFTSNYVEVSFLKDFKFRQNIGFNYAANGRDQYYPRTVSEGRNKKGWALKSTDNWGSLLSESYVTYNKQVDKHSINVFGGGTFERTEGQWTRMDAAEFPNDDLQNENMGAGAQQQTMAPPYNNKSQSTLISFLARANYSFNNKYLVTASLRRDGSSKFGRDNKWADFPSFAVAWKMSEEEFISDLNVFSDLKLRASYGETGNQGIGSYASLSKLVVYNYPFGGGLVTGLADDYYAGPANDQLKWETTISYNLGLDLGFFNNRLNVHVDAYKKNTNDLLQNVTIPSSSGYGTRLVNSGSIENKGLEIVVEGVVLKRSALTWNTNFNISWNRNKIVSLGGDVTRQFAGNISTSDNPFIQEIGHPIGTVYGYVEDGFYDNEAEVRNDPAYSNQPDAIITGKVGEIKYKDLDGVPGITEADRTYIGNVNPNYVFGFTNNFSFQNWDLSIFVNGSQGNDVVNMNTRFLQDVGSDKNITRDMYNSAWTEGKVTTEAKWPKIIRSFNRNYFFTRRYLEDGSYVRIKNITIGYKVPFKSSFVSNFRLALGVNNLYTFTGYSGFDPEVNGFGDNPAFFGVDLGGYPNTRTFNFTIQATF